ncbi:DUF5682 family protein [Myxococcota bacterium]|nr:DUF5682 family protein [Myxococcota bacterium]
MRAELHVLGIRHHGPGSARAVRQALDALAPDHVLLEGPPDGDAVISLAADVGLVPPVALLVHQADRPTRAVYYPFAEFSPEWQAMRWALEHAVPVRFMDLPQSHRLALSAARLEKLAAAAQAPLDFGAKSPDDDVHPLLRLAALDPLAALAKAAGFDDGERWWEQLVEHRREHPLSLFEGIAEAMGTLRATAVGRRDEDEPHREAFMRKVIRETDKHGARKIAVVCGAWHVPALSVDAITREKKGDDALLSGLPKVKTAATWVPWTHGRLTFDSGYGAGVEAPGWYAHLWRSESLTLETWMTRAARLLRAKDLDVSSAHVIEATRLADALASLRGRAIADLGDVRDAIASVFSFDGALALELVRRELLVGEVLGAVPEHAPMVPLAADLLREQKRLRLKAEAAPREKELDLREVLDRERSHLLHRLRLLGIPWGEPEDVGGQGTFKELWTLTWDPAFSVDLVDKSRFGTTIESAAAAVVADEVAKEERLSRLAAMCAEVLLADLGPAVDALSARILEVAAIAADVSALMEALPPLVRVLRYGNVRETDTAQVRRAIDGILPRIVVNLAPATSALDEEAARLLAGHVSATDEAVSLLSDELHRESWRATLVAVATRESAHGLVRGRALRLSFDAGAVDGDEAARQLSFALSRGRDPHDGAMWLEGFLSGSGLLLVHDARLLALVDAWVAELPAESFEVMVPLVRRTFSVFAKAERRQIGRELVKLGPGHVAVKSEPVELDRARAELVYPTLAAIFGVKEAT